MVTSQYKAVEVNELIGLYLVSVTLQNTSSYNSRASQDESLHHHSCLYNL